MNKVTIPTPRDLSQERSDLLHNLAVYITKRIVSQLQDIKNWSLRTNNDKYSISVPVHEYMPNSQHLSDKERAVIGTTIEGLFSAVGWPIAQKSKWKMESKESRSIQVIGPCTTDCFVNYEIGLGGWKEIAETGIQNYLEGMAEEVKKRTSTSSLPSV
ncbi:hypothetical protein HDV00_002592 [Rhizophlyctis rosea]|nr:hypothetical protein HDV00_002592 [Rhizophlyctis rosea]